MSGTLVFISVLELDVKHVHNLNKVPLNTSSVTYMRKPQILSGQIGL